MNYRTNSGNRSRICFPRTAGAGASGKTTACCSTASYGSWPPAPPGATSLSVSARGGPSTTAFARGPATACGNSSCSTCRSSARPTARSTGTCSSSTAASSAPTRLRPGLEKKIPAGERPDHALGRSRGGFSTKFHLVCEGQGLPLSVEVGPGQEHETQHVISLVEHLPELRDAGGAACRPAKFAGDKGYSAGWVRQFL